MRSKEDMEYLKFQNKENTETTQKADAYFNQLKK
jgi:hypothetical protein